MYEMGGDVKDGRAGLLGGMRQRKADNHVFDISVSGEREWMGEKKMNRQGIRGLQRKTASLKMLSLLNASGRKWEEGLWSEKNRESKKEKRVRGEKKGEVKEASYANQSISKLTL